MSYIHSFAPIESSNARVLILGSIPSAVSIQHQQYYAHPRNAFWKIMGDLADAGPELDYQQRCEALKSRGIALWDVLKCCTREGSLDSGIDNSSIKVNDLGSFFESHTDLEAVLFNGAKAEQIFYRQLKQLVSQHPKVTFIRLPSTSPAHAAKSFSEKLTEWKRAVAQQPSA